MAYRGKKGYLDKIPPLTQEEYQLMVAADSNDTLSEQANAIVYARAEAIRNIRPALIWAKINGKQEECEA